MFRDVRLGATTAHCARRETREPTASNRTPSDLLPQRRSRVNTNPSAAADSLRSASVTRTKSRAGRARHWVVIYKSWFPTNDGDFVVFGEFYGFGPVQQQGLAGFDRYAHRPVTL